MQIFEIHITGEERIITELNTLNIKNIVIELLKPDLSVLRTEYMSSFILKCENYKECKKLVDNIVNSLKSKILRVKIESPVYPEYVENSLYLETHFIGEDNEHPLSRNVRSGKIMGTERVYDRDLYNKLIEKWKDKAEVEICLYDDYVREDFDWFSLYKK